MLCVTRPILPVKVAVKPQFSPLPYLALKPHITNYINHIASQPNVRRSPLAIIADLWAFNFPTGRQRLNDSGATSSGEALFEVKTITGCHSRYSQPNTISPANRRARLVRQEYERKIKKLDRHFAESVVGDGNNGIVGPFERAMRLFYRKGVIPLCSGWFGDINEDFDKVITILAQEAAAGDHGLRISPLVNNDRKGGALPIMLQQFRRAIGCTIVRGNARLKLSRMHYLRATAEEAAATCRANHSDNKWKKHQHGRSSWFSQHTPDGYRNFEQFRNGYDFCVP